MEHPSETKQYYDDFFRIWSYGRISYTLDEITNAWNDYQQRKGLIPPKTTTKSPKKSTTETISKSPKRSPNRSPNRSPPAQVCTPPNIDDYLESIKNITNIVTEKEPIIIAIMRKNGTMGTVATISTTNTIEYVSVKRNIYSINSDFSIQQRIDPQLSGTMPNINASTLLDISFRPLLDSYRSKNTPNSGKTPVIINIDWALRLYKSKGCKIDASRASIRRDMLQEMSWLLNMDESAVIDLLNKQEMLLTPEKRSRLELYLLIKNGTLSDSIEDPIDSLRWIYVTKLKGTLVSL